MKCKDCDNNFLYTCTLDSLGRETKKEAECFIGVKDLKCFKFDGGEIEYVMARNKDEAIKYYNQLTGFETDEYDIEEIKEWHNQIVNVETPIIGWKEVPFLEVAKENYNPSTFEPYIISTTCY